MCKETDINPNPPSPGPTGYAPDPDSELTAWWEAQAADAWRAASCEPRHRCPPDMPPCPECQEREDEEAWLDYDNA